MHLGGEAGLASLLMAPVVLGAEGDHDGRLRSDEGPSSLLGLYQPAQPQLLEGPTDRGAADAMRLSQLVFRREPVVWSGRYDVRGRTPAVAEQGVQSGATGGGSWSAPEAVVSPPVAVTRAAEVRDGRTVSRTPCHGRRVRIEGDASGSCVAVRCPYC